jgi:hypothetical protein
MTEFCTVKWQPQYTLFFRKSAKKLDQVFQAHCQICPNPSRTQFKAVDFAIFQLKNVAPPYHIQS